MLILFVYLHGKYSHMRFFTALLDGLVGFVQRNPLLCIVLAVLAIACPPLFGAVMWLFAGIAVFVLVFALLLILHLKKLQRRASESFRQQQYYNEEGPAREGEVKVHRTTAAPQKKVKDDVGEYVDFEEEKQNDKQ